MIGLVCHFLVPAKNGTYENVFKQKNLRLTEHKKGHITKEKILATYRRNLEMFRGGLEIVSKAGYRHFRMSSSLLPLADVVGDFYKDDASIKDVLSDIGGWVKKQDLRLTVHPGQFCVLSSESNAVIENSKRELSTHAWLFDQMGLDQTTKYAVNIHGGKKGMTRTLVKSIKSLPASVRNRLTLENDETCYNTVDLLEAYQETGVPVCWDSHHHTFNTGELSMDEAFEASCATWPSEITPLQHLSNTNPAHVNSSFTDRRKHSDYVHYVPDCQLSALRRGTVDVEAEFKMKNLAIDKMLVSYNLALA